MLTCMKHSISSKKLAACVNDLTVRSSIHVVCQWSYDAFLCFFIFCPLISKKSQWRWGKLLLLTCYCRIVTRINQLTVRGVISRRVARISADIWSSVRRWLICSTVPTKNQGVPRSSRDTGCGGSVLVSETQQSHVVQYSLTNMSISRAA